MFKEATSHRGVEVLKDAIERYGKPKNLSSRIRVIQFAAEAEAREKGLTEFETFLMKNHIKHIV